MRLATCFTSLTPENIDVLTMEFRDHQSASDSQLPSYEPSHDAVIDNFWAAMADVRAAVDMECFYFSLLSQFAKCILVLLHSNADPESLLSMLRAVVTEQQKHPDPSTVNALLSAEINNDRVMLSQQGPCHWRVSYNCKNCFS